MATRFRKKLASHLRARYQDIGRMIDELLGHKSVATTQKYLGVNYQSARQACERMAVSRQHDRNVTVIEDVSTNIRYSLAVMSARGTSQMIADGQLLDERAVALMDVPIFQTFEGYILREGFRFTYYWIDWEGEASKLDLQR